MYVDPFVAGIVTTLPVEVALFVAFVIHLNIKKK